MKAQTIHPSSQLSPMQSLHSLKTSTKSNNNDIWISRLFFILTFRLVLVGQGPPPSSRGPGSLVGAMFPGWSWTWGLGTGRPDSPGSGSWKKREKEKKEGLAMVLTSLKKKSAADVNMEMPVLVWLPKSSMLSLISFQLDNTFRGAVSATGEKLTCTDNMVTQEHGSFCPHDDPKFPPNKKKWFWPPWQSERLMSVIVTVTEVNMISSTSFLLDNTFCGVASADVEQLRWKALMVAQGHMKLGRRHCCTTGAWTYFIPCSKCLTKP